MTRKRIEVPTTEDLWFSAKNCFACNGSLKRETRNDARVLVCTKCGVVNASIQERSKK
jgi:hypothetical protein